MRSSIRMMIVATVAVIGFAATPAPTGDVATAHPAPVATMPPPTPGTLGGGVPLDTGARGWLLWEAPGTDPATCLMYVWAEGHTTIRCDDGTEIGS
jgi:hypothetical protein